MNAALLIAVVSLVVYIPLASALLYTWWKYGKGEKGVSLARAIFLTGSFLLLTSLVFI
jgi:hypothetical protein